MGVWVQRAGLVLCLVAGSLFAWAVGQQKRRARCAVQSWFGWAAGGCSRRLHGYKSRVGLNRTLGGRSPVWAAQHGEQGVQDKLSCSCVRWLLLHF